MKKSEREYLNAVAELGCLICGKPAQIHHVRSGCGMSQRSEHIGGTLPLCPEHHKDGGFGIAFHAGSKIWQKNYGTEEEMLEEVRSRLVCEFITSQGIPF